MLATTAQQQALADYQTNYGVRSVYLSSSYSVDPALGPAIAGTMTGMCSSVPHFFAIWWVGYLQFGCVLV